jgi:hypothetical protein
VEFLLPIRGKSLGMPQDKQPPLTSGYLNNVRPRDVLENRVRIGQRPGLDKWSSSQVGNAEQPIVAIVSVSSVI